MLQNSKMISGTLMVRMLDFYQNLPALIDTIVFSVGFFSVRWYSIAYLAGFAAVYGILRYRIFKGENDDLNYKILACRRGRQNPNFKQNPCLPERQAKSQFQIRHLILDFMLYAIAGLLIGGRLGYALLYDLDYYLQNPLAIVSPYDFSTGIWMGIFGMSYFGGAMGVILASWMFARKNKIDFWAWTDFVLPAVPAGYFFGRIGNFLNGELYGRITEKPWGMYFPADFSGKLRHPSQLYESFFEGLILFLILWRWRHRIKFPGQLLVVYLFCYGFFRFGIEFFREPDRGARMFWKYFTLGQVLAVVFIFGSMALYFVLSKRKKAV